MVVENIVDIIWRQTSQGRQSVGGLGWLWPQCPGLEGEVQPHRAALRVEGDGGADASGSDEALGLHLGLPVAAFQLRLRARSLVPVLFGWRGAGQGPLRYAGEHQAQWLHRAHGARARGRRGPRRD